jgi:hypothetical protein
MGNGKKLTNRRLIFNLVQNFHRPGTPGQQYFCTNSIVFSVSSFPNLKQQNGTRHAYFTAICGTQILKQERVETMSIEKKSLISTLKTTKKANVASAAVVNEGNSTRKGLLAPKKGMLAPKKGILAPKKGMLVPKKVKMPF